MTEADSAAEATPAHPTPPHVTPVPATPVPATPTQPAPTGPNPTDPAVAPPRFRLRSWQLVVIDVLTAVGLTALAAYSSLDVATGLSSARAVLVWLLALAVGLPLAVRRRWPVPVLSVVLGSTIVAVLVGISGAAAVLALAVALYPVALVAGRRCAAGALAAAVLGSTLAGVLSATVLDPYLIVEPGVESFDADLLSSLGFSWFSLVTSWALGRGSHARRAYAVRSAEHRVQQAVSEERLRIAREMHDVVAHSMSVIVMKAAVANHVYATRPEESRAALGHIEAVGRAALADIQHVLGSLRSSDEPGAEGNGLAPSPDLDALPGLIENARMAGVQVELDHGTVPALPAALQLSAYRIVQEALTNVIKHAAPARCTVRVAAEAGELHLAVIDDGAPRSRGGAPGHGLIGMRERAALHHGTLTADRRPEGGFAVHARLPYEAS